MSKRMNHFVEVMTSDKAEVILDFVLLAVEIMVGLILLARRV